METRPPRWRSRITQESSHCLLIEKTLVLYNFLIRDPIHGTENQGFLGQVPASGQSASTKPDLNVQPKQTLQEGCKRSPSFSLPGIAELLGVWEPTLQLKKGPELTGAVEKPPGKKKHIPSWAEWQSNRSPEANKRSKRYATQQSSNSFAMCRRSVCMHV